MSNAASHIVHNLALVEMQVCQVMKQMNSAVWDGAAGYVS